MARSVSGRVFLVHIQVVSVERLLPVGVADGRPATVFLVETLQN